MRCSWDVNRGTIRGGRGCVVTLSWTIEKKRGRIFSEEEHFKLIPCNDGILFCLWDCQNILTTIKQRTRSIGRILHRELSFFLLLLETAQSSYTSFLLFSDLWLLMKFWFWNMIPMSRGYNFRTSWQPLSDYMRCSPHNLLDHAATISLPP